MKRLSGLVSKYKTHIIEAIVFIILGWLIGHSSFSGPGLDNDTYINRANSSEYKFTNPLLSCNISENSEFAEYKPLEKKIDDLQYGDTASVYYRDLNSGRWFGTNEDLLYSPASLLKVPVMIAYLKLAEEKPNILNQYIEYTPDFAKSNPFSNAVENYKSKHAISVGNSYTISDLIDYMVEYSDNNGLALLYSNIDKDSLSEVMSDLRMKLLPNTSTSGTVDFVTVKTYSYLFRLLYNSTYLNHEMSEKALSILSKSDFDQGIVAGVPKGIAVSHKFGERTDMTSNMDVKKRELHDCGIVYYPGHPYLLCIMTSGKDFDVMSSTIKGISSAVYKYIDKEYKE